MSSGKILVAQGGGPTAVINQSLVGVALEARRFQNVQVDEPDEEDDPLEPTTAGASVRVRLTREQAAAFVRRGRDLVVAGRPPCRFCGFPIDPDGHACPRMN